MRATMEAKELLDMLKDARSLLPSVPERPSDAGVLLEVSGGTLTASGHGPRGSVHAESPVEGGVEGEIFLLPRPLESFLRTLGRSQVTLEAHDGLRVTSEGGVDYMFRRINGRMRAPGSVYDESAEIPEGSLAAALAAARISADPEDSAVQVRVTGGRLLVETTDNYRLSQVEVCRTGHRDICVIANINDVEAAAKDGAHRIAFAEDSATMRVESHRRVRSFRLMDRPFPPVDSLVNRHMQHRAVVSSAKLLAAVERVLAVSHGRPVEISLSDEVEVSGGNPEVGSGGERFACEHPGEPVVMTLRGEYLADIAKAEPGELSLEYKDGESALRVVGPRGVHMVMPQRRA